MHDRTHRWGITHHHLLMSGIIAYGVVYGFFL
jgi:hypothetical protein